MSTVHILGKSGVIISNDQQPSCWISRSFACLLNIPKLTEFVSLPVNADMGCGHLTSVVDLSVVDQLTSEVVLGKDWISFYWEYLISKGIMNPICPDYEQQSENAGVLFYCLLSLSFSKFFKCVMQMFRALCMSLLKIFLVTTWWLLLTLGHLPHQALCWWPKISQ